MVISGGDEEEKTMYACIIFFLKEYIVSTIDRLKQVKSTTLTMMHYNLIYHSAKALLSKK